MQIEILKSKIHRATVTEANIHYVGSITIDECLLEASNIIEFEKVHVLNINNGERIETYVIKGKEKSAEICSRRYCYYSILCPDGVRRSQKIQAFPCIS
jgi:aspartate 1-decarboxylase